MTLRIICNPDIIKDEILNEIEVEGLNAADAINSLIAKTRADKKKDFQLIPQINKGAYLNLYTARINRLREFRNWNRWKNNPFDINEVLEIHVKEQEAGLLGRDLR